MAETKPLTLVSLEYGKNRWDNKTAVLDENSMVRVSMGDGTTKEVPLKEYTSQRSITQKVERKIEDGEETRQDALDNLLAYLKSDAASDVEKGSLFLVQHAKDGEPRCNDYDIYVLMGDTAENYKLQRIGTSIEYGGSTAIKAGKGVKVNIDEAGEYEISLDDHAAEIYDYIGFAQIN